MVKQFKTVPLWNELKKGDNMNITAVGCNPKMCPFCVDDICTFECASASLKNYFTDVLLDDTELNNIDSSKLEQKGEYYE